MRAEEFSWVQKKFLEQVGYQGQTYERFEVKL